MPTLNGTCGMAVTRGTGSSSGCCSDGGGVGGGDGGVGGGDGGGGQVTTRGGGGGIISQLTSAGPAVLVVELDSASLRARESMASTSP